MAKPKRPKSAADADPDASAWGAGAQRVALHAIVAAVLVAGCLLAFFSSRDYVNESVAAPAEPPRVVFKSRPAWMTELVARQLAGSFRPAEAASVFDQAVLAATTKRLRANPWVAKVNQVRRAYGNGPGDTIEVDCDFRAPIALARSGADYWFVDADGVKLPEKFRAADLPNIIFTADGRTNVRVIDGVRNPPPAKAGQKWAGEDLMAGVDMVRHLYGQPFAEDVIIVKVDNFAGRVDPREAHLVLATKYNTEVRWGRPWRAADQFVEVPPDRKVANLRRIVSQFGRVDAKQPWIDIRFDQITAPNAATDAAQTAGAR